MNRIKGRQIGCLAFHIHFIDVYRENILFASIDFRAVNKCAMKSRMIT